MAPKRILLIGLDPILVNFRPERGRNAEQVMGKEPRQINDWAL
jgi:hypothetical protein